MMMDIDKEVNDALVGNIVDNRWIDSLCVRRGYTKIYEMVEQ